MSRRRHETKYILPPLKRGKTTYARRKGEKSNKPAIDLAAAGNTVGQALRSLGAWIKPAFSGHRKPIPPRGGSPVVAAVKRRSSRRAARFISLKWIFACLLVGGVALVPSTSDPNLRQVGRHTEINREQIASSINHAVWDDRFPSPVPMSVFGETREVNLNYTIDSALQSAADSLFARYHPDFGAFVAMDPETGRILAMSSFIKDGENLGNLNLRNTFPAASVFKTVTAAAVLDQHKLNPESVIPYNGKAHTLYKRHVLHHTNNKWTRRPTLREAYAKSINPVFGRIGVKMLGAKTLGDYAKRFGFGRTVLTDFAFDTGKTEIDPHDVWTVAEAASGFTRHTTISPLQGAMIAATAANEGVIMRPYVVSAAKGGNGVLLYSGKSEEFTRPVSEHTATLLRRLMRETVKTGTARKSFRSFLKEHPNVEVGGKTGTLIGFEPKGQYDWFIGYAIDGKHKFAFAALTVNKKKWTVKSHYVAKEMIETWLDEARSGSKLKVADGN